MVAHIVLIDALTAALAAQPLRRRDW